MRILGLLFLALLLGACSSGSRTPVEIGADAAVEAQAAEAHIRSHMAIDGCPAGFHAVGIDIGIGSDAFIGIQNGNAETSSAANGQRRHRCVKN